MKCHFLDDVSDGLEGVSKEYFLSKNRLINLQIQIAQVNAIIEMEHITTCKFYRFNANNYSIISVAGSTQTWPKGNRNSHSKYEAAEHHKRSNFSITKFGQATERNADTYLEETT